MTDLTLVMFCLKTKLFYLITKRFVGLCESFSITSVRLSRFW